MTERLGALILLSTLTVRTVSQHKEEEQIPLTIVKPGDNFTIICSVDGADYGLVYWYRMRFEPIIQTIAEGSFEKIALQESFNNHRFHVAAISKKKYSLSIFNVSKEDEASYFCQVGSSYKMSFINTTFLMVLDQRYHTFSVKQISSASAPLGGSVQLNCSLESRDSSVQCPSRCRVHWFKSGSEKSPASSIYTYTHQSEEQDQRKCVYSLTTALQDINDTGTYYCAVVSCGEVLFGRGTTVEIKNPSSPVCVVLGVLLFFSTVINAVMFFQYRKANHQRGVLTMNVSTEVSGRNEDQSNVDNNVAGVNYVALDFPLRNVKRKNVTNTLPPECFYSTTRQNQ